MTTLHYEKLKVIQELRYTLRINVMSIQLGSHTPKRLKKRGYFVEDIYSCIKTGKVVEIQQDNDVKYVVEGLDMDNNPIVCVFARQAPFQYKVVTTMPPFDKNRFSRIIA